MLAHSICEWIASTQHVGAAAEHLAGLRPRQPARLRAKYQRFADLCPPSPGVWIN
jgi:hypothetical protein